MRNSLADELIGRGNAHGAFDARGGFERFQAGGDVADADDADDDALLAFDGMDLIAELRDALADVVDFCSGGVGAHGNDHDKHYTLNHCGKSR